MKGPVSDEVPDVEQALSHLSPEDYLVERSRRLRNLDRDPAAAKSWLVTAQMIFPQNFTIAFEAYNCEKAASKAVEAAKSLSSVMDRFDRKQLPDLNRELTKISSAAIRHHYQSGSGSESDAGGKDDERETEFLRKMFEALPAAAQKRLLLDEQQQEEEQPRLVMLAFDRFPDMIVTRGASFLRSMLSRLQRRPSVKVMAANDDLDSLTGLVVLEVASKLLPVSELRLDEDVLQELLHVTLTYSWALATATSAKRDEKSWKVIYKNVERIGLRLKWEITDDLSCVSSDELLRRLQQRSINANEDEAFSVSTLAFLRRLHDYNVNLHCESGGGDVDKAAEPGANCSPPVLVEAFITEPVDQGSSAGAALISPGKRRRTTVSSDSDSDSPILTHAQFEAKSPLIEAFLGAVRHFDAVLADARVWERFQQFRGRIDNGSSFFPAVTLYKGQFREALQLLQTGRPSDELSAHQLRLATVHFALGNHHAAAGHLIAAVKTAKKTPKTPSKRPMSNLMQTATSKSGRQRHLHFLPMERRSLLEYACRMLVSSLQPTQAESDAALGHSVVLMQMFDLDVDSDLFLHLLHRVRMRNTFCYPAFASYVIRIEVLEEFSAMMSDPQARVALDLGGGMSPGSGAAAGATTRRMGTRGANRGEKEEAKAVLRKLAARSREDIEDVIVDFLDKSSNSILHCLI